MSNEGLVSNEDVAVFLHNVMETSSYPNLASVFLIEAIRFYSETVQKSSCINDPEAEINPLMWKATAIEIGKRIDRFTKMGI